MKNLTFIVLAISLFQLASGSAFAQVEQVTSATVANVPALIASMQQYRERGDSKAKTVSLVRHIHDGQDPSTHTVVALYDDLEDLEETLDGRQESAAWATLMRSLSGNASITQSFLAIQRLNWGDALWKEGDYLVAVAIRAPSDAELIAAMDELMSASKLKIPGMIRVMRVRGNPMGSHAVLISASSFEELISYQESMEASAPFAAMREKQAAAVQGALYYRVVKVWD